jgi:hypothetical protein
MKYGIRDDDARKKRALGNSQTAKAALKHKGFSNKGVVVFTVNQTDIESYRAMTRAICRAPLDGLVGDAMSGEAQYGSTG